MTEASANNPDEVSQPGVFLGRELHFHITGAISASLVPWWLHWFRTINTEVKVNASITRSALQFVSLRAVSEIVNGRTWVDQWSDASVNTEVNYGASGESECFIVFPSTLDSAMRLSQGRCDSPALMMLQMTELPIIIGATFPGTNSVVEGHLESLRRRRNIDFVPNVESVRAKDRSTALTGFDLPAAISIANSLLARS